MTLFAMILATDYNRHFVCYVPYEWNTERDPRLLRKGMKYDIPIRIIVKNPLPGVRMQVQRGRDELALPTDILADALVFDIDVTANLSGPSPNFLGKYVQGPKDARFVYVNSGSYAGQPGQQWNRRAKISLMSITAEQVVKVTRSQTLCLATEFEGVGKDGGPACASIKGIVWRVVNK